MFDTMIVATEVETAFAKRKQDRINARFLKGPILMQDIGAASRLPGQALSVLLALHHQTALTKKQWVTLPKGLLMQLGISRDAKARALQQLEAAALIRVVRPRVRQRVSALLRILTPPKNRTCSSRVDKELSGRTRTGGSPIRGSRLGIRITRFS